MATKERTNIDQRTNAGQIKQSMGMGPSPRGQGEKVTQNSSRQNHIPEDRRPRNEPSNPTDEENDKW